MKKNTKSRKISDAKRKKHPKIRFNFMILIIIFVLSFAACFALYIVAANLDDNFFPEDEGSAVTAPSNRSVRSRNLDGIDPCGIELGASDNILESGIFGEHEQCRVCYKAAAFEVRSIDSRRLRNRIYYNIGRSVS